MLRLLQLIWSALVLGGAGLLWWFMCGPWEFAGPNMSDRDWIRFGQIPMTLSVIWVGLVLFAAVLTLVYLNLRARRNGS
jgi:hypothetical protein